MKQKSMKTSSFLQVPYIPINNKNQQQQSSSSKRSLTSGGSPSKEKTTNHEKMQSSLSTTLDHSPALPPQQPFQTEEFSSDRSWSECSSPASSSSFCVTNSNSSSSSRIEVVCRFRPLNEMEKEYDPESSVISFEDGDESTCIFKSKRVVHNFTFDKIFTPNSTQEEIFEFVGKPVIEDVCKGYNGTIFAYGQTGSGKSFTMMGVGEDIKGFSDHPKLKGIIPRSIEYLFQVIEGHSDISYTIDVSFIEIYMERIKDLLEPIQKQLKIERKEPKGVFVKGAKEVRVHSSKEIFQLLKKGASHRVISSTRMNSESSRSHTIIILSLCQKNITTSETKYGKLILVDLAGSEKTKKTGAVGTTLEEAKQINKSLSALGMVIYALSDSGGGKHVPYRDSKLTRLLEDSIGGNSRTKLIINCSMSPLNDEETLSTLRFGSRAKRIQNKVKVNRELSQKELKAMLDKAKEEVLQLRQIINSLKVQQKEDENIEKLIIRQEIDQVSKEKEKLQDLLEDLTEFAKRGSAEVLKSKVLRSASIVHLHKGDTPPRRRSMIGRSNRSIDGLECTSPLGFYDKNECFSETSSVTDDDEIQDWSEFQESVDKMDKLQLECSNLSYQNNKLEQQVAALKDRNKALEHLLQQTQNERDMWKQEALDVSDVLNRTLQSRIQDSIRNQNTMNGNVKAIEMLTLEMKTLQSQVSFFDISSRSTLKECGALMFTLTKAGFLNRASAPDLVPASPTSKSHPNLRIVKL